MRFILKAMVILSVSLALIGGRVGNVRPSSAPVLYPYMDDAAYEKERQKLYARLSSRAKANGMLAKYE